MIGYTTLIVGVLTALAFYIIMWKIDIKKFAGYNWQSDLLMMIIVSAMFFGTLTGMIVAVIAGVTMSILLTLSQFIFGAEKYTDDGWVDYKVWAAMKKAEEDRESEGKENIIQ